MSTAHKRYSGNRVKIRDMAVSGMIRETRPYLSRILMEWVMKCDLVRPTTALGLRLKTSMNLDLSLFGVDEYKLRPWSPARWMKTFPVLLWSFMRSQAVSRFPTWLMLERQVTVLGMDHWFFLGGPRSFRNP